MHTHEKSEHTHTHKHLLFHGLPNSEESPALPVGMVTSCKACACVWLTSTGAVVYDFEGQLDTSCPYTRRTHTPVGTPLFSQLQVKGARYWDIPIKKGLILLCSILCVCVRVGGGWGVGEVFSDLEGTLWLLTHWNDLCWHRMTQTFGGIRPCWWWCPARRVCTRSRLVCPATVEQKTPQ